MIKDIILGAVLASAVTTEKGRKLVASAGKVGLKIGEKTLREKYGLDVKSLLEEEKEESEDTQNE